MLRRTLARVVITKPLTCIGLGELNLICSEAQVFIGCVPDVDNNWCRSRSGISAWWKRSMIKMKTISRGIATNSINLI